MTVSCCVDCGSPDLATYTRNGRTRTRNRCQSCHTDYCAHHPSHEPATCRVCGAPGVRYTSHGVEHVRPYCARHWCDYVAAHRKATSGLRDGWQTVRAASMRPPPGIKRLIIDERHGRATYYIDDRRRVTHYKALRILNTREALVQTYQALGYIVTKQRRHGVTLEKLVLEGERT